MRYRFEPPPGWRERPFPPPQRGVYLTAPPDTPRASILLMDAIQPVGTLEEQADDSLRRGCSDAQTVTAVAAAPLVGHPLPGAAARALVRATWDGRTRDEIRLFALFEGLGERLPIVFLGDPDALAFHAAALHALFASIEWTGASGDSLY